MKAQIWVVLLCLGAFPAAVAGQISTFAEAYDRLVAESYHGLREGLVLYGKPEQVDGPVIIKTEKAEVTVGHGPGWVFYRVDTSRARPFYYFHVVSTSGEVSRVLIKEKPLNADDYQPVTAPVLKTSGVSKLVQTLDEAYAELLARYLGHVVGDRAVYGFPERLTGPVEVKTWTRTVSIGKGPGWLFFIDDRPEADWEHGCRYVFLRDSGEIDVERATTPPNDLAKYRRMTERSSPAPVEKSGTKSPPTFEVAPSTAASTSQLALERPDNRWAVIISGGGTTNSNHTRYWNDCSYFYKTLMKYGFRDDQIYVICSDGTDPGVDRDNGASSPLDLDGDGDDDIQYSATVDNVTNVFGMLERKLNREDSLLYVMVNDHGGSRVGCPYTTPDVKFFLWQQAQSDTSFASALSKVPTRATVCIFKECYSGGMIGDLAGPNRVLMSASRFWEVSYGGGGDASGYGEFTYYVIQALAGAADAELNNDHDASMEEAYLYALAKDTFRTEAVVPANCGQNGNDNYGEHPCYYSNPWDLGRKISLNGIIAPPHDPIKGGYRQREIEETFPSGGTAMNWQDDDNVWSYDLPFDFPFFGSTYRRIWVDSNGIINLGNGVIKSDPSVSDGQNQIDRLRMRSAIAPLWDDLSTAGAGHDIFVSSSASWVTIRWAAETVMDATPRPVNFAVQLGRDGAIRFLYGTGNEHTSRIEQRDKSIGISKGDGATYHLCLRNGQDDLGNANGIEFLPCNAIFVDPKWTGVKAGTRELPFSDILMGQAAVQRYGFLCLKGGTHTTSGGFPIKLTRALTVTAYEGAASIGGSP